MPYEVRKKEGTEDEYEVVNTETGDVKATHKPPDAKEKAERQVHILEMYEEGEDQF